MVGTFNDVAVTCPLAVTFFTCKLFRFAMLREHASCPFDNTCDKVGVPLNAMLLMVFTSKLSRLAMLKSLRPSHFLTHQIR